MFQLLETRNVKLEYDPEKQSLRKLNGNRTYISPNNIKEQKSNDQLPLAQNQVGNRNQQNLLPSDRSQLNPTAPLFYSNFKQNSRYYAQVPNGPNLYRQNPVYNVPNGFGENLMYSGNFPVYVGQREPVRSFVPTQPNPGFSMAPPQLGADFSMAPPGGDFYRPSADFLRNFQPKFVPHYQQYSGGQQIYQERNEEEDRTEREQKLLRVQHRDETVEKIKTILLQMSRANE